MKWFIPPTKERLSQMQAAMHDPSTVIITRQDLHGVVLEMVIEIEEARFPGLARLLLELLQRRRPCPHGTRRVVGVGRHRLNAWRLPPINAGRQRHAARR